MVYEAHGGCVWELDLVAHPLEMLEEWPVTCGSVD